MRVYFEPCVANNAFTFELIGSDNGVISGTSKTFTTGTNITAGDDYAWYAPEMEPTYSLGVRITNTGSKNMVISKVEIDFTDGGK